MINIILNEIWVSILVFWYNNPKTPSPRGLQAPAESQVSKRNTRIKRRKIRGGFVGYFDVPESEVYTSEFTVRARK